MSTADLLPTFVELAGGTLEPGLPLDGRSLVSHLQGQGGHDEVFGEYMPEGTISPLMMIRRGAYKFIYSESDPCLLFDVDNDPREMEELSQSPLHRQLFDDFSSKRGPSGISRQFTRTFSPVSAAAVLSPMR